MPCASTLPVADNDWPADPIAAASLFLDDAVQALPRLRAAYDDDPADLYLYDIGALAARALAEAQGRPLVQLSPTFVGWDGYQEEVAARLRKLPGADAYRDRFARWLAECGATTTDVDVFSGPPARALALVPRAMQPHADRVDTDTVTFVGPCFDTRADTDGWTRPAGADHVLLISLGSAYKPARVLASASPPSATCSAGTSCSGSASTPTPRNSAPSRPTSSCAPGSRSGRSCNRPTPSSPTPAWAAAAKGSLPAFP